MNHNSAPAWHVPYQELLRLSRERALLGSCSALLGWDEQTTMPTGGVESRAEQLGLLAGLIHERATSPRVGSLLDELESTDAASDPDSAEAVNLRELRRVYDRQTRLPRSLVEELATVTSAAQHAWIAARAAADFDQFRPWLERIVGLKRQESACLDSNAPEPYDALLDEYEPGATSSQLAPLFDSLRRDLVSLLDDIQGSPSPGGSLDLKGPFPVDRQKALGEMAAGALGFDFKRGRLDISAHPFCSGIAPGDCRITTRYRTDDFAESFFGVLHETGHALYEQGLDPDHYGSPMGEAVSLGVHESQSRLWENLVGRSHAFWAYWFPIVRGLFRDSLADVDPLSFLASVNRVQPSLIRTQADEVTYNLHIAIRFRLERALLRGDLPVADVPTAWDEAYLSDLGLQAPTVADGCLQDIHWSAGLFGYFPTYTLGNVYAAQLFDAALRELGDVDSGLRAGDYVPLLDWLRRKIHRQGQRYRPARLIEVTTGRPPDSSYLTASLRSRYAPSIRLA